MILQTLPKKNNLIICQATVTNAPQLAAVAISTTPCQIVFFSPYKYEGIKFLHKPQLNQYLGY